MNTPQPTKTEKLLKKLSKAIREEQIASSRLKTEMDFNKKLHKELVGMSRELQTELERLNKEPITNSQAIAVLDLVIQVMDKRKLFLC